MEKIDVIFRIERSGRFKGAVTAVFPTFQGTNQYNMMCYSYIGQHGTCTMEWYRKTRPARLDEYGALLRELQDIYWESSLCVKKKITPKNRRDRQ